MPDLRRHWFFILLSLAERNRHGSGIVRDVLDLTGGELRLWPVTLYGSLDELRENGWIRELGAAPEPDEDRGHRRWFRITPQGRRALLAEMERMRSLVAVALRRAPYEHWRRRGRRRNEDPAMRSFLADLRFAFRSFGRQPGATALIVVTLMLGVAA